MLKHLLHIVLITGAITSSAQPTGPAATKTPLPAIPNLAGKVLTVLGPIDPSAVGQTLMHEHIFIDYKPLVDPTPRFKTAEDAALYEQPFTLATVYAAR